MRNDMARHRFGLRLLDTPDNFGLGLYEPLDRFASQEAFAPARRLRDEIELRQHFRAQPDGERICLCHLMSRDIYHMYTY